jgi:hypothetical protein
MSTFNDQKELNMVFFVIRRVRGEDRSEGKAPVKILLLKDCEARNVKIMEFGQLLMLNVT